VRSSWRRRAILRHAARFGYCEIIVNDYGPAEGLPVNRHCLFDSFEAAKDALKRGLFVNREPGPYRIIAVYTPGAAD
jgi:hypothetical protein